jgi:phosphatidylinositol glycan class B
MPGDHPHGKRIYILAALVFLLTAWFSSGYNHFDEHFQVIEFAGLKLGLTEKQALPWEYGCQMRPAIQPLAVYCIYKTASAAGLTDPFLVAFIIRLFSALLTFLCIHLTIRLFAPGLANKTILYGFLLLSFFLWFVPYNAVRFSAETVAGRVFLIGAAWFFLRKAPGSCHYLFTGLLLGLSFIIRYQAAFMVVGFGAWLVFIHRAGLKNTLIFSSGIIAATALGVLIDRWFYGDWVLTSWNYFSQNILQDKAATFGVSPWWYYIEQTFLNAFPPLSVVYILAVFLYFILFPKDFITWTLVPFLAIHFLIPHKEIRFLFPLIGFLPVMIIRVADKLLHKRGYQILEGRIMKVSVRIFWYLNMVMLAVLIFRPADDALSLYEKLWNEYRTPARLCFTDDNPYHRAKVDIHFYKRKNLELRHIDSIESLAPAGDTVTLVVLKRPGPPENDRFTPVLIYSTYPSWMRRFNINHWMDRTSFWYVYEMKPANPQGS